MKHKWPIGTIASVKQLIESGLDACLNTGDDLDFMLTGRQRLTAATLVHSVCQRYCFVNSYLDP